MSEKVLEEKVTKVRVLRGEVEGMNMFHSKEQAEKAFHRVMEDISNRQVRSLYLTYSASGGEIPTMEYTIEEMILDWGNGSETN